ncbi:hypothetical protein [Calothrix sp. PCC 6303]|uniref:hypothetical protein n=1 Tax=Calothrix sp. PCC 6303 TaxID=1170562 RepID=UPI0002A0246C|nr:hypothetical protein [Calothrix sp. PCC 6303]AFZ03920.1 hypothetical protein Cal6303_5030 [Calothrix sp. PCC 6303]
MRYHKVVAKGSAIAKISMQTDKYLFAQELITDTEGNIRKMVIDFKFSIYLN